MALERELGVGTGARRGNGASVGKEDQVLRIYPVTLAVARAVARVLPVVARADSDLARQLRRAVASVPLNIAEGMYSRGKLRQARYHTALGPSREVLACLEVAVAMGYLKSEPSQLRRDLDRVIGTLVKLVG